MYIARIDTNAGSSLIKKENHGPSSREAVKFMQTLKKVFVTLYRYIMPDSQISSQIPTHGTGTYR